MLWIYYGLSKGPFSYSFELEFDLRGCEIDAVDGKDWTALHYAAQAGHVDVVSKLIVAGKSKNLEIS